jgi:hypothetical protein
MTMLDQSEYINVASRSSNQAQDIESGASANGKVVRPASAERELFAQRAQNGVSIEECGHLS